MQQIQPLSGRLVLRQLNEAAVILGSLRFDPSFVPVESALYAGTWMGGALDLWTTPVAGPPEGHERYGDACSWLTAPLWKRAEAPGVFTIRFIEANPAANEWTAVALSAGAMRFPVDEAGHAWFDIAGGAASPIRAPIEARGMAVRGLLAAPVWPVAGELSTLPNLPAWQRPYFVRHHELLIQVGQGTMQAEEAKAAIRQDPELFNLCAGLIDVEFCRYLAARADQPTVERFGPIPAEQHARDEAHADKVVRRVVTGLRLSEMQGLAGALGVPADAADQ